MKKVFAVLLTLLCAAAGFLRWSALSTSLDPASGFPLDGRLLPQYGLIFLPLLLIGLTVLLFLPAGVGHRPIGLSAVPAFCGMLFSGILSLCLYLLRYGALLQLICALLLLLGSLWFAGYIVRHDRATLVTGMAALLVWLIISILAFRARTASIWHVTSILELLGCLSALLFLGIFLRSVYGPGIPGTSRFLCFAGFACFYLGSCLMLPQELWQWSNGLQTQLLFGKSIAAAGLGLSGLITALQCLFSAGYDCADAAENEETIVNPQADAAFAEAAERLEREPFSVRDTAPVADRWQNAAATLYGDSTAQTAQESAPQTPSAQSAARSAPPVPPTAAASHFASAENDPSAPAKTDDTVRPKKSTAPETDTAATKPTTTAKPITLDASFSLTKPVIPSKPIDVRVRPTPSADTVLADLELELPVEDADDDDKGSGWVFHRE